LGQKLSGKRDFNSVYTFSTSACAGFTWSYKALLSSADDRMVLIEEVDSLVARKELQTNGSVTAKLRGSYVAGCWYNWNDKVATVC